jgi:DNA repair protein RecN (Recombination protein N)
MHKAESLAVRIESSYIELKDIAAEAEKLNDSIELDPERLEIVKQRLDLLYSLFQKHKVAGLSELMQVQEQLGQRLQTIDNFDTRINELQRHMGEIHEILEKIATQLSEKRKKVAPVLENKVVEILQQVGIPYAVFLINFEKLDELANNGKDEISYLFSANKQSAPQEIAKVASGGEISRVMLAIKSVIASTVAMPAIIFDEIDTGVSGEIADKMGSIMKDMAKNMQVISITHLPQVAAKGGVQYFVYKTVGENSSNTRLKLLNNEERVIEIAKMLSGKDVSEAAINNARVLLGMR